jgi:hypothetical protein
MFWREGLVGGMVMAEQCTYLCVPEVSPEVVALLAKL